MGINSAPGKHALAIATTAVSKTASRAVWGAVTGLGSESPTSAVSHLPIHRIYQRTRAAANYRKVLCLKTLNFPAAADKPHRLG